MRDECPHCGADLPPNAKACPECGSDEETGWSEAATLDRLDLPGESFDYQDFIEREFEGKAARSRRLHWLWWTAGVVLLAPLMWLWLRG